MNWSKTVPEGRKALASNLQSLLISVYPVQTDLRKFFQDGFAVATHAKGAIYKNGTIMSRWFQEFQTACNHYRHVSVFLSHVDRLPSGHKLGSPPLSEAGEVASEIGEKPNLCP